MKEEAQQAFYLNCFSACANPFKKCEIHLSFPALSGMLILAVIIQGLDLGLSLAGPVGEPAESAATENDQAAAELEEEMGSQELRRTPNEIG